MTCRQEGYSVTSLCSVDLYWSLNWSFEEKMGQWAWWVLEKALFKCSFSPVRLSILILKSIVLNLSALHRSFSSTSSVQGCVCRWGDKVNLCLRTEGSPGRGGGDSLGRNGAGKGQRNHPRPVLIAFSILNICTVQFWSKVGLCMYFFWWCIWDAIYSEMDMDCFWKQFKWWRNFIRDLFVFSWINLKLWGNGDWGALTSLTSL